MLYHSVDSKQVFKKSSACILHGFLGRKVKNVGYSATPILPPYHFVALIRDLLSLVSKDITRADSCSFLCKRFLGLSRDLQVRDGQARDGQP